MIKRGSASSDEKGTIEEMKKYYAEMEEAQSRPNSFDDCKVFCWEQEVFENESKDSTICNRCHKGKIKVFEDCEGYSVKCDYCKAVNHCRCQTKEMAINFWVNGITRA